MNLAKLIAADHDTTTPCHTRGINDRLTRHRHPAAIKRLVQQGGAQLRPFTPEIMEACYKAAVDTYAEIAGTNENFKKMHDAYMAFRNEEYLWFQIRSEEHTSELQSH